MKIFQSANENELIKICITYRYISLAVSTFAYFYMYNGEITQLRLGVAGGIIAASVIGNSMYKRSFTKSTMTEIAVTMCLEVIAYGVFIIFSGGFLSPYLWYFVSSLTVVMAAERLDGRFKFITPPAVLWCLICALIGGYHGLVPGYAAHSNVNTGIAFLVVAGGFYTLFGYAFKLDKNRQELRQFNESLQHEIRRSEQALQDTMSLYESFNLFSITDPDRVMEEITALLYRTIACEGCLLLKINPLQGIERTSGKGLAPGQAANLIEKIKGYNFMTSKEVLSKQIEEPDGSYDITYISNSSGIQGLLFTLQGREEKPGKRDPARETFYHNLVGIIMQQLDLQAMAEAYVVCEEQNRIANEIHDTVIQKLFAVVCSLHLFDEEQADMEEEEKQEKLKYIAKAIESTMKELRETIYGLRWEGDSQNDFWQKLSQYMDEVRYLSGADIRFEMAGDKPLMTTNQKTAFYRIICEAVNNAIRHGQAAKVSIRLSLENENLVAEVTDNGAGFSMHQSSQKEGQGLKNMYKMTNMLKGKLVIESQIGRGTTIKCSLPK
ncbi:MAG: histidine kinase [Clostridiales bacterium]